MACKGLWTDVGSTGCAIIALLMPKPSTADVIAEDLTLPDPVLLFWGIGIFHSTARRSNTAITRY